MKINYIFYLVIQLFNSLPPRHIVAHTHDDLGWVRTIQEYYIEKVEKIFTSVLSSLQKNSSSEQKQRKFIYSEIGFLKMFIEQDQKTRQTKIDQIKTLMSQKRWEFVNGGISQPDTACSHYEDLFENTYYGLWYLQRNFQTSAVTGWQLDPFGHSAFHPLMTKMFGINEYFINRANDKKREILQREFRHSSTFIWKPFGKEWEIRTHMTPSLSCTPPGISCDGDCDIKKIHRSETDWYFAETQLEFTFDPWHLFGCDFFFTKAENNFQFIDGLFDKFDNIRYSLFSDYIKSIEKYDKKNLFVFQEDFFVNDEGEGTDAWSGFFSAKPRIKIRIRRLGKMLRNFKLFVTIFQTQDKQPISDVQNYLDISEEFGIFTHHDCITGTAKRYVDEDWLQRMDNLEKRMIDIFSNKIKTNLLYVNDYDYLMGIKKADFKNISEKGFIYLNIFNQNGALDNYTFTFPEIKGKQLIMENKEKEIIIINKVLCFSERCIYSFEGQISFLNVSQFKLSYLNKEQQKEQQIFQEFSYYKFQIKDNHLQIFRKEGEQLIGEISLWTQESQQSGAYILKYDNKIIRTILNLNNFIIEKNLYFEKLTIFSDNWDFILTQNIKDSKNLFRIYVLFKNLEMFQPGIDLLLIIKNSTINSKQFFVDSNGSFYLKREKEDHLENSVFPFTQYAFIQENKKSFYIFTEHSQGITSEQSGEFTVYIQRSASRDDEKGVEEILQVNEPFLIQNIFLISENENEIEEQLISIKKELNQSPLINFSQKEINFLYNKEKSLLNDNITLNVDFLDENNFIVKIQNINLKENTRIASKEVLNDIFGDLKYELVKLENIFNNEQQVAEIIPDILVFTPFQFIFVKATIKNLFILENQYKQFYEINYYFF